MIQKYNNLKNKNDFKFVIKIFEGKWKCQLSAHLCINQKQLIKLKYKYQLSVNMKIDIRKHKNKFTTLGVVV